MQTIKKTFLSNTTKAIIKDKTKAYELFKNTGSVDDLEKYKSLTKKVKKVYVALDSDAKKDSAKLVQFLMDNGIESYLLNMNEKDPSELGFENFWKRISKTEKNNGSILARLLGCKQGS